MERHQANARRSAPFLQGRSDVARSTTRASAGWSRSSLAGGDAVAMPGEDRAERAIAIAEATRWFTLAESLGGVESLIEVPAAMTHTSVAGSPLEVDPALVRLSVGIEGVDDLIDDLRQALDRA
jgi:cystathionine gamma-synthase